MKNFKTVRHYKTVKNALEKHYYEYIHVYRLNGRLISDTAVGHMWLYGYASGYIEPFLNKRCRLEYNPERHNWDLMLDY